MCLYIYIFFFVCVCVSDKWVMCYILYFIWILKRCFFFHGWIHMINDSFSHAGDPGFPKPTTLKTVVGKGRIRRDWWLESLAIRRPFEHSSLFLGLRFSSQKKGKDWRASDVFFRLKTKTKHILSSQWHCGITFLFFGFSQFWSCFKTWFHPMVSSIFGDNMFFCVGKMNRHCWFHLSSMMRQRLDDVQVQDVNRCRWFCLFLAGEKVACYKTLMDLAKWLC